MKLPPDPRAFADADEVAQALEAGLRNAPLSGPKKKVVKEVKEWAVLVDLEPDDPGLLETYNDAAERAPEELRVLLDGYVQSELGRRGLIRLLGRTGAGDQVGTTV